MSDNPADSSLREQPNPEGAKLAGDCRRGTLASTPQCAECPHPLGFHTVDGCHLCECQQMWDAEQEAAEVEVYRDGP